MLLPYYHPTRICFVDDNQSFLLSIVATLPNDLSALAFHHPEEALEMLNRATSPPLSQRIFRSNTSDPDHPLIDVNLTAVEQEINRLDRFERISVVFVDYAMPKMTGLEFCERIQDRHIKRVLLTGVADEKTAVEAFNLGLIDHYLPKASLDHGHNVASQITSLQQAYFKYPADLILNSLPLAPPAFMTDRALVPKIQHLFKTQRCVEYYLTTSPYGYLMLQANGIASQLIVMGQEDLQHQITLAETYGAPRRLVEQLAAGQVMLYLAEHPQDYLGNEQFPWFDVTLNATRVDGDERWFIGLHTNPAVDVDFEPTTDSYAHFRALERWAP